MTQRRPKRKKSGERRRSDAHPPRKVKWYEDPDGQPRHPHYWVVLGLGLACIGWVFVDVLRHYVFGGDQAGVGWIIAQYFLWQGLSTAAIVYGFNPKRRAPNLFRLARVAAIIPLIALYAPSVRAFVSLHLDLVQWSGLWILVNLVLPRFAPPRDPRDPYQDVIKR